MHTSDSNQSSPNCELEPRSDSQPRSLEQLSVAMSLAIERGDTTAVSDLLRQSSQFGDSASSLPLSKCKVIARRGEWLETALNAMRSDLEEDRFASAVGHFREALGISRGLPALKAKVDRLAVRTADELLPENWRIAQTLLHEASLADPPLAPDAELSARIQAARDNEFIEGAIHKAERSALEGRTSEARQKLIQLQSVYPNEAKIDERLKALDDPESVPKPELITKVPAVQVETIAKFKSTEPELDSEGTLTDAGPGFLLPWGKTKIFISQSAWNALKNFAALSATTVMLGTAGVIVWAHFTHPVQPARAARSAQFRAPVTLKAAASSLSINQPMTATGAQKSIFQDVPVPLSDQDGVLQVVGAYRESSGKQADDLVVDEVDIKGKQATVRYRPRQQGAVGTVTFLLVRDGASWKVLSAH